MDEPETVPFNCPLCCSERAELIDVCIHADPWHPCLKCCDCGTLWRVNLYEVEERNDTK